MKIPRDKILHLVMGAAAVIVTVLVIELAKISLGGALAFMTTAFGAFYEFQQWYRKEGQVEVLDAVATAAPGFVAWAAIELIRRFA